MEPAFRILMVVPTLGQRLATLARTLASITGQTGVPVDTVLVAKSASAELQTLAQRFGCRVVLHPGHISEAANAGFATATPLHRYAGWLGDDDMLLPGSLRAASARLESAPAAVLTYGDCDYIDIDGRRLFTRRPPPGAPFWLQFVPGLIKQETCLFRLDALRRAGGADPKCRYAMDLDLLLRMRRLGPLLALKQPLAAFCWHPQSLTIANRGQSLVEAQDIQRRHAGAVVRLLQALLQPLLRGAILLLSRRITRASTQPPGCSPCAARAPVVTAGLRSLLRRQRFVRFVFVGVLNTGFSYGLYVLLLAAGLPYVAANLLATLAGIGFSFRTQGRFVFGNTDGRLIVRYVACWLVIWGINIGVIHLLVQAGLDAYSAGALALLPTVLASYALQKALVFGGVVAR